MLDDEEYVTLDNLERLAFKHEFIARQLRSAVVKCKNQQSLEGLSEMVAFSFNAQQYTPNYGGGGANLPPGKYKGVIVDTAAQNTQNNQGGFLAFTLTPVEGPLAGQKHIDRLNLHHTNPKTVEIANQQLSAYCHALGVFQINDTTQLHNIPFQFEIGWQKGQEPSEANPNGGYTEVKAIYDVNGNSPGKSGSGPAPQAAPPAPPPQQPPAGVAPASAPPQGQWGAPQQQQPAPPPQGQWGAPPAGQAPPPPQQAQQPPAGAAPWGAPGGAPAGGGWPPQG